MCYNFKHSFFHKNPVFTGVSSHSVNKSCPIIYTMISRIGSGLQRFYSYMFVTERLNKLNTFFNIKKYLCILNSSPTMPP